jgi:exopolysaccharide production protein ExoY
MNVRSRTGFFGAHGSGFRGVNMIAKRCFDLVLGIAVLIMVLPLMLLLAILIYVRDPGPVIYRHTRIGQNGKAFGCFKFRTMVTNADALLEKILSEKPALKDEWERTHKLSSDPRIIPKIGSFMRRSSLDELPQLFNILMGDMSFTGPRPVTKQEVALYGTDAAWYLKVRPGLTGLWQVQGRSTTTFQERVAMDVHYVRTRSFLKDIWIILQTPAVVLRGRGAY